MKTIVVLVVTLISRASITLAAPIPEGEFSPQSLREGVAQSRTSAPCGDLFVIQAKQACAAARAADKNECEALVPLAARNLCFGVVRSRSAEPCDTPGVLGIREKVCVGARSAERGQGCDSLADYSRIVCGAYLKN